MAGFDMKDYIDVAERIQMFRDKHPEGSLTSSILRYPDADFPFIVVQALAWRTPEDLCPGMGHAAEPYPGKTPYTKDSEVMVAETSAWGRAIVASLAADTKRGIASKDEIRNRKSTGVRPPSSSAPVDPTSAKSRGGGNAEEPSKADRGKQEATGEGVTSTPVGCAHTNLSPLLPTGRSVKEGFTYCVDCRALLKESALTEGKS